MLVFVLFAIASTVTLVMDSRRQLRTNNQMVQQLVAQQRLTQKSLELLTVSGHSNGSATAQSAKQMSAQETPETAKDDDDVEDYKDFDYYDPHFNHPGERIGDIRSLIANDCLEFEQDHFKQRHCDNFLVQRFNWTADGLIRLFGHKDTNLCADITAKAKSSRAVKRNFGASHCQPGSRSQQFSLERVGAGIGRITVRNADGVKMCLTAADTSWHARKNPKKNTVTIEECRETCFQVWRFTWDEKVLAQPQALVPLHPGWAEEQKKQQARLAQNKKKLLCWVMSSPKTIESKAVAVNATWGKRCDILLFMSTEHHDGVRTVKLYLGGEQESRALLWRKGRQAWLYVYHHYLNKADWFMRCDDDSYVMMDNLREFLNGYDHNEPHYLGRTMVSDRKEEFYGGGAGNILSRAALRKFGEAVHKDASIFSHDETFADDVEISNTLRLAGVPTEDTRDKQGRERFFPLGLDGERTLERKGQDKDHWFFEFRKYPQAEGVDCCSRKWIISHYTPIRMLYNYETLHSLGCEAAGYDEI